MERVPSVEGSGERSYTRGNSPAGVGGNYTPGGGNKLIRQQYCPEKQGIVSNAMNHAKNSLKETSTWTDACAHQFRWISKNLIDVLSLETRVLSHEPLLPFLLSGHSTTNLRPEISDAVFELTPNPCNLHFSSGLFFR